MKKTTKLLFSSVLTVVLTLTAVLAMSGCGTEPLVTPENPEHGISEQTENPESQQADSPEITTEITPEETQSIQQPEPAANQKTPAGDENLPENELTAESMLKDYKDDLAKYEAGRVELVKEVEELNARKDELLLTADGDAAKLSAEDSDELAAINERLDTIHLNSGDILDQPDMYDPEVYFVTQTKANLEGAEWTIKSQTPGTADHARTQAYIDMYTECLEMYDAGEELDDILLYNFSQVLYINSAEFGK